MGCGAPEGVTPESGGRWVLDTRDGLIHAPKLNVVDPRDRLWLVLVCDRVIPLFEDVDRVIVAALKAVTCDTCREELLRISALVNQEFLRAEHGN